MGVPSVGSFQGVPSSKQGDPEIILAGSNLNHEAVLKCSDNLSFRTRISSKS